MLNTPAVLQSNLDSLNLKQIIKETTRYNPKRPPLITVKRSLKHFCEQAYLIDLARVSWKDIDLIPSVEDAWSLFKSNFLTILKKHAPFKK